MFIADLHIHSKYSRATSSQCTLEYLDLWARRKGIQLVGTGDFTHPAWREEMREKLIPAEEGLYVLKKEYRLEDALCNTKEPARFILSGEISCIYKKNDKVRKVHNVILLPALEAAESLSKKLEEIGNIHSDGRPILGLDSRDLLEITLDVCPQAIFIPAHIWTPHFSLFGAFSQFQTIEECYGDLTPCIHALETGLSSDPPMNYRLSALDQFQLISNSDAHSPAKLGREANLFDTELSYPAVAKALNGRDAEGFAGTIEFFPEEGKYHLDGHRNCAMCLEPSETIANGGLCPVCGKKLTVGVLHRVEELADRPFGYLPAVAKPFESLVPLPEVIAASMGVSSAVGKKVQTRYETMLRELGNEFYILREAPFADIEQVASFPVAEGIRRMREGKVSLAPGFDGEYGKVKLFEEQELEALSGQMSLFGFPVPKKAGKKAGMTAALQQPIKKEESHLPSSKEKDQLNIAQRAAVTAEEPVVAVVAGPGTGKTKTLISRILYLLKEKRVAPEKITAVTFTNKAAEEMRQRLTEQAGKRLVKKIQIGTFHSICLRLLPQEEAAPVLIDEFEAEALAAEVLKQHEAGFPAKDFLKDVARIKYSLLQETEYEIPPHLVAAYQEKLEEYGVMDFDDVILRGFEQAKLQEFPCFTYLLVDEFQDVNPLQYQLIRAWSKKAESLFVIGDPDQSIYGFRGSDAACFDRLHADYAKEKLRLVKLEENYRSTPEILSCAVPVIDHNPGGQRLLRANLPNGAAVRSLDAESDYSEAIYVAHEIDALVGGVDMLLAHSGKVQQESNLGFSDVAVLYRTHRQAEALEYCLRQQGVPYVVAGRDKTLSKPIVRGVLGFFRSILNENDRLSRETAIRLLFGNPADDAAQQAYKAAAEHYKMTVDTLPPKTLLEQLLAEITLPDYDGAERLLCMAVCYDSMRSLLNNVMLGRERDLQRSGSESYQSSSVTLMTFHGAKGLEFPVVFLCGARAGLIPLETEKHTADIEEERRLFYVGMTRAKHELILLHSGTPSRFLGEIPGGRLKTGLATHQKNPSGGKQLSLFE